MEWYLIVAFKIVEETTNSLERVEDTKNSVDEDSVSNGRREFSPVQGPALPILQKIACLSSEIEVKI